MPKPPSPLTPPLAAAPEFPDEAVPVLNPPTLKALLELDDGLAAALA